MAALPPRFIPNPPLDQLKEFYLGKQLGDVPTPAAVVDRAVVERNCAQMLDACRAAGTVEVTALQVGKGSQNVNIIVSTLNEAGYLLPYLLECRDAGRNVNVLYGLPLSPSQVKRLAYLGRKLGPGTISVLVDHPDQLTTFHEFVEIAGVICIYIKVDTGYHRAGLPSDSILFKTLLDIIIFEGDRKGYQLCGFYSHAGHSYGVRDTVQAMDLLIREIKGLKEAADIARSVKDRLGPHKGSDSLVLSVGATPSASSIECLCYSGDLNLPQEWIQKTTELRSTLDLSMNPHIVEIHAGVYPFLDMQQLATAASSSPVLKDKHRVKSYQDVALTILAEVASTYETRDPPEAIIAAGSLALGREPCQSYSGWGVVTSWEEMDGSDTDESSRKELSNWFVARISQEHGVLQSRDFVGDNVCKFENLKIGQKVRIFPNHACVAGAGFGYYLVVDSRNAGEKRDEIVDVWVRCRGW